MKASRCVDIVDDEAEVRDALILLLSTAQIESRYIQELSDGCCRSAGRLLISRTRPEILQRSLVIHILNSPGPTPLWPQIDDPSEHPAIAPAPALAQLSKNAMRRRKQHHRQMRAEGRSAQGQRFESPPLRLAT
jgi:hypothetical protein